MNLNGVLLPHPLRLYDRALSLSAPLVGIEIETG